MPEVVSLVKLGIPNAQPVSDEMANRWANRLTDSAAYLHQQLRTRIPDAGVFEKLLADGSNKKWRPMIDPAFVSQSERTSGDIITMQGANLKDAYDKWDTKIALAFETVDGVEAKRFKDQVQNSKDNWITQVEQKTLRMTGDKGRGLGAAPIAGYWLSGDLRASGLLRVNTDEVLKGGPVNVARTGLRTMLKAGLIQKLVQSGVLITKAGYAPAVITQHNTAINDFLKGLQSPLYVDFQPTIDPVKSYCVFVWEEPLFRVEIQVVKP
ncbi:MAG: hypothetical protein HY762_06405 [Planctomycetes bacterium]|nr:hypothetical protein [Planctomycetota bacterium]